VDLSKRPQMLKVHGSPKSRIMWPRALRAIVFAAIACAVYTMLPLEPQISIGISWRAINAGSFLAIAVGSLTGRALQTTAILILAHTVLAFSTGTIH
jgi:hypothetical protein